MKTFTAALLSVCLVTGGVTVAMAQSGAAYPAAPAVAPADAPKAPDSRVGETKIETKTETRTGSTDVRGTVKSESRDDSASALPRTTSVERTTIFGLSPTAAVIIAAALLLVVILAIVAMTRSNDTYIDTNRRV